MKSTVFLVPGMLSTPLAIALGTYHGHVSNEHRGRSIIAAARGRRQSTCRLALNACPPFLAAKAVIEGSTVVVTGDKIPKPVAVRYGWAMVPDVNLFNREGLPAVPFRTDQPVDPAH